MPPSPTGSNREAAFHRSTWQKLHGGELRFNDSASVRVSRTTRGIQFRAKRPAGNVSLPELMEVIEFHFDYLVCRPEGAPSDGTGDVNVALKPELRSTIDEQVIFGDTWTFDTYTEADQSRMAHLGETDQQEWITPAFLVRDGTTEGDWVAVQRFKSAKLTIDGVALKLMEVTPRAWAAEP